MQPTVYGSQEPYRTIDLSSAARYGAIHFVLDQRDNPGMHPGPAFYKLKSGLRDFQPHDYVFYPGGDTMSISLMLLALRDLGFKEVNLLRWERNRELNGERNGGFYVPQVIPLTI